MLEIINGWVNKRKDPIIFIKGWRSPSYLTVFNLPYNISNYNFASQWTFLMNNFEMAWIDQTLQKKLAKQAKFGQRGFTFQNQRVVAWYNKLKYFIISNLTQKRETLKYAL